LALQKSHFRFDHVNRLIITSIEAGFLSVEAFFQPIKDNKKALKMEKEKKIGQKKP